MVRRRAENFYLHTFDFGEPSWRNWIEPNRCGNFKSLHPLSYSSVVALFVFCIH
jgi:hypothetical protein